MADYKDQDQKSPEQERREKLQNLLAWRLRDAMQARETSGIEEIWLAAEDQYNGYDEFNHPNIARTKEDPQGRKATATPGTQSTIYLNITKPKTDTAVSRVQEMLLPHDDKPWEVEPTPVPELANAVDRGDDRMVQLADGRQAKAADVAKATMVKAQQSAERAGAQIEDWFVEGSVYAEMRRVIKDAGRIGTGVLKGPFPVAKKDRKWSIQDGASVLEISERIAPSSRRIDAWDLFPDPSCGDDIHAGAYIFERDYFTARKLRGLARQPGYDAKCIAEVLEQGPTKRARLDKHNRQNEGEVSALDTETFEVFYYQGDIPPEELLAAGFEVVGFNIDEGGQRVGDEKLAEQMRLVTIPVVATLVNDKVVRMSMNPQETGEFQYDVFVWEPVDGQVWGRGIPTKMEPAQKILNAGTRRMLENAGMSAGPQVVTAKGSIEPWNGRYTVEGRKGWHFMPSELIDDVRKAFAVIAIDPMQQHLMEIIRYSLEMADQLTNMPMFLQGIVGTAPDTLGATQMQEANASAPLKAIAKQFDDLIVVPHLRRYYDWLMQDPNVPADAKGDMQVRARGASVLVQRDQAALFYAQLVPLANDPKFRINPEKLAAELARANKASLSQIQYSDEEWQAIQEQMQNAPQPQDPRIATAQINAQVQQDKLQAEMQDREVARQHQERIKAVELQIQALEFAGQKEIKLDELKAMLAQTAIQDRTKRELFVAEKQFAQTTGDGRGL